MATVNQHGLSRYIPSDVRHEIRRRSKFGCVQCRSAIYQYEHIDPEFTDAKSHDPNNMCLLCGGCHDRVTRGRLSKQTIRESYDKIQRSELAQRPFEGLDLRSQSLTISFGTCTFRQSQSLISINGESILSVLPPLDGEAFPCLSGTFYDKEGIESFRISSNVWEGPSDCWDIEVIGQRISIKTKGNETALELELLPPDGIRVLQLSMYKDNCHLVTNGDELLIGQIHSDGQVCVGLSDFQCLGSSSAISVDSRRDTRPSLAGMRIIGGEGIFLDETGIIVGMHAANMTIGRIRLWDLP